jgi:hypothetical protein
MRLGFEVAGVPRGWELESRTGVDLRIRRPGRPVNKAAKRIARGGSEGVIIEAVPVFRFPSVSLPVSAGYRVGLLVLGQARRLE